MYASSQFGFLFQEEVMIKLFRGSSKPMLSLMYSNTVSLTFYTPICDQIISGINQPWKPDWTKTLIELHYAADMQSI